MPNRAHQHQDRFSYAHYLTWPEEERWEIVDGIAWAMSPAPSRIHQDLVGNLFVQIKQQLKDRPCSVYIAPFDVRLAAADAADDEIESVVQPDISIFCDRSKLDDRGAHGAPEWIIEILSPATALRDQTTKRDLYARHGVSEYWLVHPGDRTLTCYRHPTEGRYGVPHIVAASGTSQALIGVTIDWDEVFA
jgi:Uma2 family endonuclease